MKKPQKWQLAFLGILIYRNTDIAQSWNTASLEQFINESSVQIVTELPNGEKEMKSSDYNLHTGCWKHLE